MVEGFIVARDRLTAQDYRIRVHDNGDGTYSLDVCPRPASTVHKAYKLAASSAPQAVSDAPGAGLVVVVDDMTISTDTGCLLEIVMETTGNLIAAFYLPAYGSAYLMNVVGDAVNKKLMLKTSTSANVAVVHNYHVA